MVICAVVKMLAENGQEKHCLYLSSVERSVHKPMCRRMYSQTQLWEIRIHIQKKKNGSVLNVGLALQLVIEKGKGRIYILLTEIPGAARVTENNVT